MYISHSYFVSVQFSSLMYPLLSPLVGETWRRTLISGCTWHQKPPMMDVITAECIYY